MKLAFKTSALSAFLLAAGILLVIGAISFRDTSRLAAEAASERRMQEVLSHLNELLLSLSDVHTCVRGYVVAGTESFLEPYHNAAARVDAEFQRVRELGAEDPRHQRWIEILEPRVAAHLTFSRSLIELRRTQGFEAAQREIATGNGKKIQDEIHKIIADMQQEENQLLQERKQKSWAGIRFELWVIAAGSLQAIALLGLATWVIHRDFAARIRAETELQRAHDELERRVEERTAELARTNRALKTISECNQLLVRATEETELLQALCRIVVEHGGYRMAWVGFAEQDAAKTVRPAAQVGFEAGYFDTVQLTWADSERGRGPTGVAIRSGQPVLARNIPTHPAYDLWREAAIRRGYASSIAVPLQTGGRSFGALMIYAAEPEGFNVAEVELLTELANDLACGIAALRDRAELKRAQEAVRNERDFSEAVLNSLPGIFYCYDENRKFLRWNKNFERVTGYTGAEIARLSPLDLFAGADKELLAARIQEVFDNGVSEAEADFVAKDSTRTPYYFSGQATEIDGQRCLVGMGMDITERKEAETALRASEARVRSLFEQANDGIFVISAEHRYLDANARGLEMLGYTRDELMGMSVLDVLEPHEQPRMATEPPRMMAGVPHLAEWEHRRKDGSTFPGEVSARKLNDQAYLAIVRDQTARERAKEQVHRLHEDLRRHAEELERRVAERTAELAEAKDRAEAADRLKSAFLATMSHELRTPLNSVIGFTGILLQGLAGSLNAEQTKQLRMVKESAHHLLALINDVLDISKIEAGLIEIANAPFDLREAIQKVVQTVAPLADKKHLLLVTRLAPDVGRISSDRRRVEQVLLNLLSNAIKFTERGEVRVECSLGEGLATIRVTDTGIGIRPEDLSKLFRPFLQLDSGLTRQHEGTGLGLAISKRLVARLGGEVRVESRWGEGSTFSFSLPAVTGRRS